MITYRQANDADGAEVVSLLAEIMQHHGVTVPDPASLDSVVRSALDSPYHSFLLAENGGAVVGMCALVFTYSTWSAALVCELQDVIVREAARRSSVGRGLILAAERVARERGCARLFLLAEYWNLEAHAFYRSLGLTEKTSLYFERDLGGH
jgi:N-acetylglutamate synthase-like GNAT family acetyltransferase